MSEVSNDNVAAEFHRLMEKNGRDYIWVSTHFGTICRLLLNQNQSTSAPSLVGVLNPVD